MKYGSVCVAYKEIELTQGEKAKVCDCHYDLVKDHKWYFKKEYKGRSGYAARNDYSGDKPKTIFMHNLVLPIKKGKVTDHINRDKLDNRCTNLRETTNSVNTLNSSITIRKYKLPRGVYKSRYGFMALVTKDKKRYFLGYHKTPEIASEAYLTKAKELYGGLL